MSQLSAHDDSDDIMSESFTKSNNLSPTATTAMPPCRHDKNPPTFDSPDLIEPKRPSQLTSPYIGRIRELMHTSYKRCCLPSYSAFVSRLTARHSLSFALAAIVSYQENGGLVKLQLVSFALIHSGFADLVTEWLMSAAASSTIQLALITKPAHPALTSAQAISMILSYIHLVRQHFTSDVDSALHSAMKYHQIVQLFAKNSGSVRLKLTANCLLETPRLCTKAYHTDAHSEHWTDVMKRKYLKFCENVCEQSPAWMTARNGAISSPRAVVRVRDDEFAVADTANNHNMHSPPPLKRLKPVVPQHKFYAANEIPCIEQLRAVQCQTDDCPFLHNTIPSILKMYQIGCTTPYALPDDVPPASSLEYYSALVCLTPNNISSSLFKSVVKCWAVVPIPITPQFLLRPSGSYRTFERLEKLCGASIHLPTAASVGLVENAAWYNLLVGGATEVSVRRFVRGMLRSMRQYFNSHGSKQRLTADIFVNDAEDREILNFMENPLQTQSAASRFSAPQLEPSTIRMDIEENTVAPQTAVEASHDVPAPTENERVKMEVDSVGAHENIQRPQVDAQAQAPPPEPPQSQPPPTPPSLPSAPIFAAVLPSVNEDRQISVPTPLPPTLPLPLPSLSSVLTRAQGGFPPFEEMYRNGEGGTIMRAQRDPLQSRDPINKIIREGDIHFAVVSIKARNGNDIGRLIGRDQENILRLKKECGSLIYPPHGTYDERRVDSPYYNIRCQGDRQAVERTIRGFQFMADLLSVHPKGSWKQTIEDVTLPVVMAYLDGKMDSAEFHRIARTKRRNNKPHGLTYDEYLLQHPNPRTLPRPSPPLSASIILSTPALPAPVPTHVPARAPVDLPLRMTVAQQPPPTAEMYQRGSLALTYSSLINGTLPPQSHERLDLARRGPDRVESAALVSVFAPDGYFLEQYIGRQQNNLHFLSQLCHCRVAHEAAHTPFDNIIYFNVRVDGASDSVDSFIRALRWMERRLNGRGMSEAMTIEWKDIERLVGNSKVMEFLQARMDPTSFNSILDEAISAVNAHNAPARITRSLPSPSPSPPRGPTFMLHSSSSSSSQRSDADVQSSQTTNDIPSIEEMYRYGSGLQYDRVSAPDVFQQFARNRVDWIAKLNERNVVAAVSLVMNSQVDIDDYVGVDFSNVNFLRVHCRLDRLNIWPFNGNKHMRYVIARAIGPRVGVERVIVALRFLDRLRDFGERVVWKEVEEKAGVTLINRFFSRSLDEESFVQTLRQLSLIQYQIGSRPTVESMKARGRRMLDEPIWAATSNLSFNFIMKTSKPHDNAVIAHLTLTSERSAADFYVNAAGQNMKDFASLTAVSLHFHFMPTSDRFYVVRLEGPRLSVERAVRGLLWLERQFYKPRRSRYFSDLSREESDALDRVLDGVADDVVPEDERFEQIPPLSPDPITVSKHTPLRSPAVSRMRSLSPPQYLAPPAPPPPARTADVVLPVSTVTDAAIFAVYGSCFVHKHASQPDPYTPFRQAYMVVEAERCIAVWPFRTSAENYAQFSNDNIEAMTIISSININRPAQTNYSPTTRYTNLFIEGTEAAVVRTLRLCEYLSECTIRQTQVHLNSLSRATIQGILDLPPTRSLVNAHAAASGVPCRYHFESTCNTEYFRKSRCFFAHEFEDLIVPYRVLKWNYEHTKASVYQTVTALSQLPIKSPSDEWQPMMRPVDPERHDDNCFGFIPLHPAYSRLQLLFGDSQRNLRAIERRTHTRIDARNWEEIAAAPTRKQHFYYLLAVEGGLTNVYAAIYTVYWLWATIANGRFEGINVERELDDIIPFRLLML